MVHFHFVVTGIDVLYGVVGIVDPTLKHIMAEVNWRLLSAVLPVIYWRHLQSDLNVFDELVWIEWLIEVLALHIYFLYYFVLVL